MTQVENKCPYCGSETFTNEFIQLDEGPPLKGYNECTQCHKWSLYTTGAGQSTIPDPETRPQVT